MTNMPSRPVTRRRMTSGKTTSCCALTSTGVLLAGDGGLGLAAFHGLACHHGEDP
jgi:hypothetical protein